MLLPDERRNQLTTDQNGKPRKPVHQGPLFACICDQFVIVSGPAVIEMLHKNATVQGKKDLTLGPIFRQAAEDFKQWSLEAEPGWVFQAPQIRFCAIRMAQMAPVFLSGKNAEPLKITRV